MKIAILAAALTGLLAVPALADPPGPGSVSQPMLAGMVQKQGCQITKVEADDDEARFDERVRSWWSTNPWKNRSERPSYRLGAHAAFVKSDLLPCAGLDRFPG